MSMNTMSSSGIYRFHTNLIVKLKRKKKGRLRRFHSMTLLSFIYSFIEYRNQNNYSINSLRL